MKYLAFWCACLLLCGGTAAAAPTERSLVEYRETLQRLTALVAEAEAANAPRRLKAPTIKTLLAALSDRERMLVDEGYSSRELEADLAICDMSNRAVMSFVLFDFKDGIDPSGDQRRKVEDMARIMSRNILFFQDELKLLQPFQFRCMAKAIPNLERFLAALPREGFTDDRRNGLMSMRRAVKMMYTSATDGVFDEGIQEDYRLAILSTLAESPEAFAMMLPLHERKTIAQAARGTSARVDKRYEKDLNRIARAFDSEACGVLCGVE